MSINEQSDVKPAAPVVRVDLEGVTLWQLGDDDCHTDEFPDLTYLVEE